MVMTRYLVPMVMVVFGLFGCGNDVSQAPSLSKAQIAKLIPARVADKEGWASDMADVFDDLNLVIDVKNVCTAIAIIDQESNFVADPKVPNLGEISLKALNEKLDDKLGKTLAGYFRTMLKTHPSTDKSFAWRIKRVQTERELDELFREMFDYFAKTYKVAHVTDVAKLFNSGIDEKLNPITTLGSMQVHIDYAKAHRRQNMNDDALRADLYSRYGGLYYGIHRLMLYQADYDTPLYRFADYNSGVYSSRNAAFQEQIAVLSGQTLSLDGDLLIYNDGSLVATKSQSEKALMGLVGVLGLSESQIRQDLKKEKSKKFESTATYQAVQVAFETQTKKKAKYAIMPQVVISGAKLSKDYNTNWFATNVNRRYERCLANARRAKLLM